MDTLEKLDFSETADEQVNTNTQPAVDASRFRGVYDDTLYFVDGMVEQYDFYPEIIDALKNGNASIELKKRYMLKAIDEEWVEKIEDCLPALDEIIRKPSRFIEETEKVLPIELSRNIGSRSIQHLSQHTDYISKVEGDEITPSKILNVFRDETMATYENKFINTLLNRLYIFVERRYDTARNEGKDEKNTTLTFKEDFTHGEVKARMNFSVEISEEPADGEELKNYTYTTDLWQRVIKLHHICRAYMHSDFAKNLDRQFIRPPVVRTNAILKNKNLRQCLELWEFIESYENIGYNMLVQENLEDIDPKYVQELYYSSALQYLIFRYNIRNEFESEKTLSSAETDEPLSPQIIDENKPITSSEFDKTYTKYVRTSDTPREALRKRTAKDRKLVRAIDVALAADLMMRRQSQMGRIPLRKEKKTPEIVLKTKATAAKVGNGVKNGAKKVGAGVKTGARKVKIGAKNTVKRADNFCRDHQTQLARVADTATELAVKAALVGTVATVKFIQGKK